MQTFFFLSFLSFITPYPLSFSKSYKIDYFRCSPDKSPLKEVCAIYHTKSNALNPAFSELIIFKNCQKNTHCLPLLNQPILFTCQKKTLKLRKNGKSCVTDEECFSTRCNLNRCQSNEKSLCLSDVECSQHKFCSIDSNKDAGECQILSREGEACSLGKKCGYGLECADKEGSIINHICVKWGSVKNGLHAKFTKDVYSEPLPRLCQSGIVDDENACCEVKEEANCLNGDEDRYIKVQSTQGVKTVQCFEDFNDVGESKFYPYGYSKVRTKLWKKYIEKVGKFLDGDKFYKEEEYNIEYNKGELDEWKYKQFMIRAENAEYLRSMGAIDEEGEVDGDNKCKANFFLKFLGAGFLKFGIREIFIMMFFILF